MENTVFNWSAKYETGLADVDAQHHGLVDLINHLGNLRVEGGSVADVTAALGALADYAKSHFSTEETLMKSTGVSMEHYEAHCRTHNIFLEQINRIVAEAQGDVLIAIDRLLRYLVNWLAFHILGQDTEMAVEIAALKRGVSPEAARREAVDHVMRNTEVLFDAFNSLYDDLSASYAELVATHAEMRQSSEAQLKEAQRMAHIGSWELDLVSKHLAWSDEIYRIFEIDPAKFDASYEAFLNAIHPEDRESVDQAYRNSVSDRSPYEMTHRLLTADGRIKYVHESCETVYDPDGKPLRSIGTVQDVTQTVLGEKALRESEERFRTVADYNYDWEYWLGSSGEFIYISPSCKRITGYTETEFMADPKLLSHIVHPEDCHMMERHMEDEFHRKEGLLDFRILRRDGRICWISHVCQPVYAKDGRFLGRRASNRDITARVEAETLLKASEEKFRLISSTANDAILIMGSAEEISYWNVAAENIFGYKAEEAIGRKLHELIAPPSFHADFHKGYDKFRTTGDGPVIGKTLELPALHKSGETILIELSVSAFQIEDQWQAVGLIRDITERKKKEQALFEAEERFRLTFESAAIGMALVSLDGHFLQINPALCWIVGYPQDELLQKTLKDIVHQDDLENDRDYINQLLHGERIGYHIEKRFLHKNGHIIWIQFSASLVVDEKSHQLSFVMQIQDVSERKVAVDALRQLNETLDRRVKDEVEKNLEQERLLIQQSRLAAMGEMIGNIAHQWRQPLNALGLLLANIKDAYEYKELDAAYLDAETAKGEQLIDKMSSTIDDFRNFFKPNKIKENFDVAKAVEVTLSLINHNIAVRVEGGHEILASGFPNEFSQVLLNVLNNAKDALLEKKVAAGKIDIALGEEGAQVWVTIRDNAGGIPEDILPKIFDPYFTTKEKGTGIGLYMSKMIMKHMNGDIEFHNIEDGAEFKLILPKSSK